MIKSAPAYQQLRNGTEFPKLDQWNEKFTYIKARKKDTKTEKEELKVFLFEGDMIVYVENAKAYSNH